MIKMSVRILHGENLIEDILVELDDNHKPNVQIYQQGKSIYAFTDNGIRGYDNVKELTITFKD